MKRTVFILIVTMCALFAVSMEVAAQTKGTPKRISKVEFYDQDGVYSSYWDISYEKYNGKYYTASMSGDAQKSYKFLYQCNASGEVVEVTLKYFKRNNLKCIVKCFYDRQGRLIKSREVNPNDNMVVLEEKYSYSSKGLLEEVESTYSQDGKLGTQTLFRNDKGDIIRIIGSGSNTDSYVFEWSQTPSVQNGLYLTFNGLNWPSSILFMAGLLGPHPTHDVIRYSWTSESTPVSVAIDYKKNNNGSVSLESVESRYNNNYKSSMVLY